MPKLLSENAIEQFDRDGYYFPVTILSEDEAGAKRSLLESFETDEGKPIGGAQRNKSHLLFKWVDDLMRHSTMLDAIEDLEVIDEDLFFRMLSPPHPDGLIEDSRLSNPRTLV